MPTLLELTSQGDVATITDEAALPNVRLMTPQQLYELWERQPWATHTIDFTRDREDWAALPEADRRHFAWNLASFFIGEERVATQLSGLVRAYGDQSEEAFLASQQVDEARHAQHFHNFHARVLGLDGTFEDRLARAREDLNTPFGLLFDGHLVDAQDRLLADPASVEAKVDFVTTYHMVIEGTLALTGQYFLTDIFEQRGLFPGFLEGLGHISRDEHRHVAYGTWYLQQACRARPELRARVHAKLMELIPVAAGVLVPPGFSLGDSYEILGRSSDEVNRFAFTALSRRLKVIGIRIGGPAERATA